MSDARRPLGWLFYLMLSVLALLGASPAQSPATTTVSEGLFGSRSGAEKKDAAMSFVSAALQLSDAVASHHVVDEDKFKKGLSGVIDGVVLCLNASTWSKPAQP